MTYRAPILTALLCTACLPVRQPPDINESIGLSESSGEPVDDLPSETGEGTSTETGTSGDGDGDPGDGDGDSGDGDGEPDLGALVVLANGERIGYLLDVWDYGFVVWSEDENLRFKVNAETGNVAREVYDEPGLFQFTVTPDCTGPRYIAAEYADAQDCDVPQPLLRPIIAVDGSLSGHIPAAYLETTVGDSVVIMPEGLIHPQGFCMSHMTPTCAFAVEGTQAIPVTFPLPITVSEVIAP